MRRDSCTAWVVSKGSRPVDDCFPHSCSLHFHLLGNGRVLVKCFRARLWAGRNRSSDDFDRSFIVTSMVLGDKVGLALHGLRSVLLEFYPSLRDVLPEHHQIGSVQLWMYEMLLEILLSV
jgi:hypothetical protein